MRQGPPDRRAYHRVKGQPAEKLIAGWKSETDKNDLLQRQSFLFMCLY
jgi:hypothetical protein